MAQMKWQNILVGLDHAPLSHVVFERSLGLAQAMQGRLHLFHCLMLDRPDQLASPSLAAGIVGLGTYPGLINPPSWQQLIQTQVEQTIAWLQSYQELAQQQGVSVEFSYRLGEPGHCLCDLAKTWAADVIVVGRRGRSGLSEVLLGSISNYVVHHAPCSVLVVQPNADGEAIAPAASVSPEG